MNFCLKKKIVVYAKAIYSYNLSEGIFLKIFQWAAMVHASESIFLNVICEAVKTTFEELFEKSF